MRPKRLVVSGLAALMLFAIPGSSVASASTNGCDPAWGVVDSANGSEQSNELWGVTAISPDDAWATGSYFDDNDNRLTLTEHWDGTYWNIVPSPSRGTYNWLTDVFAASTDDVWAVGNDQTTWPNPTLIEHWDGTVWSIVPTPDPDGSAFLFGVDGTSSSDVWAVGYITDTFRTLVEHWDGTTWSIVPSPNFDSRWNLLEDVVALAPDDVWAVGTVEHMGGLAGRTFVLHWDGTAWKIVHSPNIGVNSNVLLAVDARAADDLWAVGYILVGAHVKPLALHWNGSDWAAMRLPSGELGAELLGVTFTGPGTVVAVGATDYFFHPVTYQWSGGTWTSVSPALHTYGAHFRGVAATSADDVWAVGAYFPYYNQETLVEHHCP
jgi:hypothetical protein